MSADGGAVAFDLDMTLVDTRPVSHRVLERMVAEHGHDLDVDALMARYGMPLSHWLPPGSDHALFRSLQAEDVSSAEPMPGAAGVIEAVRRAGSRVVLVTAAPTGIAGQTLRTVGLAVDVVHGNVWAADKAKPLRDEACWAFVGDHPDDMSAARRAGAIAIGVGTGLAPPLGAEIDLPDLTAFPSWLARHAGVI